MKRLIAGVIIFAAASVLNSLNAQSLNVRSHGFKARQIQQQQRIQQGVASGEITRKEAVRLQAQQLNIKRAKRLAKADGIVTPVERAVIKHEQRQASVAIYRQKNDAQSRW